MWPVVLPRMRFPQVRAPIPALKATMGGLRYTMRQKPTMAARFWLCFGLEWAVAQSPWTGALHCTLRCSQVTNSACGLWCRALPEKTWPAKTQMGKPRCILPPPVATGWLCASFSKWALLSTHVTMRVAHRCMQPLGEDGRVASRTF